MLNIYFGEMEEAIYNPAVYFKNTYQDSWITNERSKAMIKDVDKSTVITIHILNTDEIVHNMEELVMIAGMFVR